jgi:hypothetical protein
VGTKHSCGKEDARSRFHFIGISHDPGFGHNSIVRSGDDDAVMGESFNKCFKRISCTEAGAMKWKSIDILMREVSTFPPIFINHSSHDAFRLTQPSFQPLGHRSLAPDDG